MLKQIYDSIFSTDSLHHENKPERMSLPIPQYMKDGMKAVMKFSGYNGNSTKVCEEPNSSVKK